MLVLPLRNQYKSYQPINTQTVNLKETFLGRPIPLPQQVLLMTCDTKRISSITSIASTIRSLQQTLSKSKVSILTILIAPISTLQIYTAIMEGLQYLTVIRILLMEIDPSLPVTKIIIIYNSLNSNKLQRSNSASFLGDANSSKLQAEIQVNLLGPGRIRINPED